MTDPNDLPTTLDETQAAIARRQLELRRLHAHKRYIQAEQERAALERARQHDEPPQGTVRQSAPVQHNPMESGLPTPPDGVDMDLSHEVKLDAQEFYDDDGYGPQGPGPDDPGDGEHAYHPDPARLAFAQGAGGALENHRGPTILDFRNRR